MTELVNGFFNTHYYTEEQYNDLLEQYNELSRLYSDQCKISDELTRLLMKQNKTLQEFLNDESK